MVWWCHVYEDKKVGIVVYQVRSVGRTEGVREQVLELWGASQLIGENQS